MSAQPTARATAIPLAAFTAVYFTGFAAMTTYWPVWLADRGLGAVEIGALLTVSQWIKVPGTLATGQLANRAIGSVPLMMALALAASIVMALFSQATGFWPLLVLMAGFGLVWPSILPLSDALTLTAANRHGFDYGRIRLWGSVSYMAAAVIIGWLVRQYGAQAIYVFVLCGCVASFVATLALPREPVAARQADPPGGLRAVLGNRIFVVFMVVAGGAQLSHAVFYGFATIAWRGLGIDDSTIGLLWAEGVVAEILLFVLAGRIFARIGVVGMLLLGALGGILRWPLMALVDQVALFAVLQLLHAFTFGAAHLGAMQFMARAIPAPMLASAQSLYYALPMGVGMGLATLLAGYLFSRIGVDAYWAMGVLSLISFGAAIALGRIWRGGPLAL